MMLAACAESKVGPETGTVPEVIPLGDEYDLTSDQAYPESVAWDPDTRTFFTTSLGVGDLTAVAADGTETVFWAGESGGTATVGLEVDSTRRRLWACQIHIDSSSPGRLLAFDLDTKAQLANFDLGEAAPGASCTDVNFDVDGIAFVTDRENGAIYRVDLDEGTPTVWSDASALDPEIIGSNGITFTADGKYLIVTKYLSAKLIRITVNDPTEAVEIDLGGDLFGSSGLNGADDAVFLDGKLYVTLVDQLMTVTPDDDTWGSATVSATAIPGGGVSGLAVAEGKIYGANVQAVEFTLGQPASLPFSIRSVATP